MQVKLVAVLPAGSCSEVSICAVAWHAILRCLLSCSSHIICIQLAEIPNLVTVDYATWRVLPGGGCTACRCKQANVCTVEKACERRGEHQLNV